MKDIVLLSSKPWKHTTYLTKLSEMTGCKVIAFLCSKLRRNPDIFMRNTYIMYATEDEDTRMSWSWEPKEAYECLQGIFPDAKIVLAQNFKEIEEFYQRENTVLLCDMEPDNDLSFTFCYFYNEECQVDKKIFYSAESAETIEYLIGEFGRKNILIPNGYYDGKLEYKDYQKLIEMIS